MLSLHCAPQISISDVPWFGALWISKGLTFIKERSEQWQRKWRGWGNDSFTLPFVRMAYVIYQNSICDKLIFYSNVNKLEVAMWETKWERKIEKAREIGRSFYLFTPRFHFRTLFSSTNQSTTWPANAGWKSCDLCQLVKRLSSQSENLFLFFFSVFFLP